MWKIFYNKDKDFYEVMKSVESCKKEIYTIMENKVKQYFSKKVVLNFDNLMIFQHKNGIHNNLMESLSNAEKEMQNIYSLFPAINLYLIKEENGTVAILAGLNDELNHILKKYDFELFKEDAKPMDDKEEEMKFLAWSTLIFDVDLVNYAKSWINHSPKSEKRAEIQTEYILMNMHFKKENISLLEKINFEKNIKTHPQYEELYQKISRIMPKIQSSMEQQWSDKDTQEQAENTIGKIKKKKKY